jgi:hypothetical protein
MIMKQKRGQGPKRSCRAIDEEADDDEDEEKKITYSWSKLKE